MANRHYYLEDELFAEFRKRYPELWEYGTTYYGYGFETIRIRMPNKGCVEYNRFSNYLKWIDHNGDKDYERSIKTEHRQDMYYDFIKTILEYQKETGNTQGDISELSGVSRRKINEYINGKCIPKVSTMKKILKSIERNRRCDH